MAHQNDSFELPKLPTDHPDLPDLPHMQDLMYAPLSINEDEDVLRSSTKEGTMITDVGNDDKVNRQKRNCISVMNKCVCVQKSFFLHDYSPDDLYNKIPDDISLDGIIMFVPRQGKSNSYKIMWDTSTVDIPIAKGELRSLILKGEDDII